MKPTASAGHVFAYGTLADPACLDSVLGHRHAGERLAARLSGYQRITTSSYPYPFIVEAQGAFVDGVLLMDLSPYDMHVLDRYEEVESGIYRREPVQVEAFACGPIPMRFDAQTYVAGPALVASTSH